MATVVSTDVGIPVSVERPGRIVRTAIQKLPATVRAVAERRNLTAASHSSEQSKVDQPETDGDSGEEACCTRDRRLVASTPLWRSVSLLLHPG